MVQSHLRRFLLACAVAGIAATAGAAAEWTPTRSFRVFSKASWRGLPQSSVMALAQDPQGLLWIGTLDGVASFDGRDIVPVPAVAGAPVRGVIAAMTPRRAGGVYVGSAAGAHIFDGRTWRLAPSSRGVAALAESRDGTLWMADTDGAVWTLADASRWRRHNEVREPVIALADASDGSIWAATLTGALQLANGRVTSGGAALPGRPGAILAASDGRIWVATIAGTIHWTRGAGDAWHQVAFPVWPRAAFRSLAEDHRGRIWAASFSGGVAFGTADGPWTSWNITNGPFLGVMSVLADREGSIWFGLNGVGMAQLIGEEWSHRTAVDVAKPSTVQPMAGFGLSRGFDPATLLVGLFASGVLRLDAQSVRNYNAADGLTEDVRHAVETEPGHLIAGTRFGIFESEHGGRFHQVVKLANGFVMGLFKSPDGRWYAATSTQGVLVRDGSTWKPDARLNPFLDDVHVRGMTWRRNGELWVATLRGVTLFRDGAPPQHLTSAHITAMPPSVNTVLDVSDDEVWAGGTGGIAVRRGATWTRMTEADGVPGQTVYSLAIGRDRTIWAGGSAGVGRYAHGRWTVWDTRRGLLQEECNLNGLVVEDDGSVFVGMMGSLAHFDPHLPPLPPPPLNLTWVSTPRGDEQGIAHVGTRDRALHLRWSAPWLGPEPVQFRVRVPRLRESWSAPMSDDHLDIENLGAGSWRAEVEARVEGRTDWTKPLALDVDVAPFWYETPLARLGMLLLLAAICYSIVRLRLRALRRHAAMLEATVEERTAQLAEKVALLHASEQRALAANRAKSAFLANMSHELRTPLNGVLGFAQLLARRKNRDAEDQEGLAVIVKSGEHLLGLINDVLSLSKIEAGRVTLDLVTFDLRKLVHDVEQVLRFRADEKQLRLAVEYDDAQLPRAVTGDEGRLRQILINLVGNAIKFTEHGGVTLRVQWHAQRAEFAIVDTGSGIAAEDLPRLFEPFVQTESGRRSREGTGLGLALSRDLARIMGGDIEVESATGKGSTFRVSVNLPEASVESLAPEHEGRQVATLAPGQPPPRILVVDDIAVNRAALSRLLQSAGFDVREASSGEEALATWHDWQPHLVWMDKWMHGMDGLEVTRRIRATEQTGGRAHTPIVALSASALEQERDEILSAGCDDFVAKPFRAATIFAKIAEFLGCEYVYEEAAPLRALQPQSPRSAATTAPQTSAGSVLLVDDDWICREVAQQLLRDNGVAVTAVASGREALTALDHDRFDLVLMDLHMPDMDGREAARRIKARDGMQTLPLVAMTAESFDDRRASLAAAGMDDYIGKPVEPEALTNLLARWLPG